MKKEIKVTSRGMVFTSRGKCRTPLLYPIVEDTSVIFKMITAQRATVVEVLPDGREIELTPQNFDQDNSNADTKVKSAMSKPEPVSSSAVKPPKKAEKKPVEEKKVEDPKVDETSKDEKPAEESKQEQPLNTKTMSRKERKRQEYLQKQKEQEAKAEEKAAEETSSDTTIPEDAIEQ